MSPPLYIARSCIPEVEPEGGPGQYLHSVTHHGHLVKGGLTIEYNEVIVHNVTLHLLMVSEKKYNTRTCTCINMKTHRNYRGNSSIIQ